MGRLAEDMGMVDARALIDDVLEILVVPSFTRLGFVHSRAASTGGRPPNPPR